MAHYAIMEFVGVYIPGDERSRTNPGHGYPATTERYATYIAYTDKAEWESEVSKRAGKVFGEQNFVAMFVNPAETVIDVRVKVRDTRDTPERTW